MEEKFISEKPVLRPWSIGAIYWAALGEPRGEKPMFFSTDFFFSEGEQEKGGEHDDMDVSRNRGTPKSSILIGFSIINHPFYGTPIFGNIHIGSI